MAMVLWFAMAVISSALFVAIGMRVPGFRRIFPAQARGSFLGPAGVAQDIRTPTPV